MVNLVCNRMWALKVLFLCLGLANANTCQNVMKVLYETEDQFDTKGCDSYKKTNPFQISTFEKQCQLLQKKMDIFGQPYMKWGHIPRGPYTFYVCKYVRLLYT